MCCVKWPECVSDAPPGPPHLRFCSWAVKRHVCVPDAQPTAELAASGLDYPRRRYQHTVCQFCSWRVFMTNICWFLLHSPFIFHQHGQEKKNSLNVKGEFLEVRMCVCLSWISEANFWLPHHCHRTMAIKGLHKWVSLVVSRRRSFQFSRCVGWKLGLTHSGAERVMHHCWNMCHSLLYLCGCLLCGSDPYSLTHCCKSFQVKSRLWLLLETGATYYQLYKNEMKQQKYDGFYVLDKLCCFVFLTNIKSSPLQIKQLAFQNKSCDVFFFDTSLV